MEKLKLIVIAMRDRLMPSRNNRYVGNFKSWEDASQCCQKGYGDDVILDKVRAATHEVVAGRAAFERDSVLFYHAEYNWPLLTALWRLRAQCHNGIGVLDFGGALGSTYWQNRKMFEGIGRLRWSVVEQPKTVACGQKEFQNEQLVFYESVDECFAHEKIDLVFLGSVLNYIPDAQELLRMILAYGCDSVIVERTVVLNKAVKDRIVVQHVPPSIYPASYPLRLFSEASIRATFESMYDLEVEMTDPFPPLVLLNPWQVAYSKSYFWRAKRGKQQDADRNYCP